MRDDDCNKINNNIEEYDNHCKSKGTYALFAACILIVVYYFTLYYSYYDFQYNSLLSLLLLTLLLHIITNNYSISLNHFFLLSTPPFNTNKRAVCGVGRRKFKTEKNMIF